MYNESSAPVYDGNNGALDNKESAAHNLQSSTVALDNSSFSLSSVHTRSVLKYPS